jgi:hypothetical protein
MSGLFARLSGASGTVKITAPLPPVLAVEVPYVFKAATLAYTLVPQARLKVDALRVAMGTVH